MRMSPIEMKLQVPANDGAFRRLALFGLNHDMLLLFGMGIRTTGTPRVQRYRL